jgi:hypothetical protein
LLPVLLDQVQRRFAVDCRQYVPHPSEVWGRSPQRVSVKETGEGRGILWDNDGVLVDTEKVFFEANRAELATLGVVATWADFEERPTSGASLRTADV